MHNIVGVMCGIWHGATCFPDVGTYFRDICLGECCEIIQDFNPLMVYCLSHCIQGDEECVLEVVVECV